MSKRPRHRDASKELLYKVLAILYNYAEEVAVLDHPRSIERRSIDLAVRLKNGKRVLIKVAYDLDSIPRAELQELSSLSSTLGIPSLIVAEVKGNERLLEGVLYEKADLFALSPESLYNVLSGREQIYIRTGKETFTVSIDGEMMRRRRIEKNLSLGDLAVMLGVSRRTIYEYEKGGMEPSIEKAERLVKILGEDIAKPIDIFSPRQHPKPKPVKRYDTLVEESIGKSLEEHGFIVIHVKRTVLDIAATKDKESDIAIVVEHPTRRSSIIEKAYYLEKLAHTVGIEEKYIIVESREAERILEKEGYEPVRLREFLSKVREKRECRD